MNPQSSTVWYRDAKRLATLSQIAAVLMVAAMLAVLLRNAALNMDARGIRIDPGFLWTAVPFKVGFTPFGDFVLGQTRYWEVFVIGARNTLIVAVAGILSATVLGIAVGIMRLSDNLLARRLASAFVETFRNLPLLLQVFFWHFIVILPALPARQQSLVMGEAGMLNREGLFLSEIGFAHPPLAWLALAVASTSVVFLVRWGRVPGRRVHDLAMVGLFCLAAVIVLSWLAGPTAESPQLARMGVVGGLWLPIPLLSLWWALTVSTAAFIAEAVRAGIIAIPAGQREAAKSLGLGRLQSMRLVEFPQALRIIIPPTISQYLNLLKNSSLAVAVGYDDIVNIWMGASLNQTGQAIIIIAATMVFFTTFSLITSLLMNIYNSRVQIQER